MKSSAEGGQAKPVAANATGFNPWKFTSTQKELFYPLFYQSFGFTGYVDCMKIFPGGDLAEGNRRLPLFKKEDVKEQNHEAKHGILHWTWIKYYVKIYF